MSDVIELLDSPGEVLEISSPSSPRGRRRRRRSQKPTEVIDLIDGMYDEEFQKRPVHGSATLRRTARRASKRREENEQALRGSPLQPSAARRNEPEVARLPSRREKRQRPSYDRFDETAERKEAPPLPDYSPGSIRKTAPRVRRKDPPGDSANLSSDRRSSLDSLAKSVDSFTDIAVAATASAATNATDDGDDSIDVIEVERPPEDAVLDVFPDAARNHVQALLQHFNGSHDQVVSYLIDNPNYPKSKTSKHPPKRRPLGEAVVVVHRESTKMAWTYDFTLASSFEPTRQYLEEAATCLCDNFPFLSKAGAKILVKVFSHYALAHERVTSVLRGAGDDVQQINSYQAAMNSQVLSRDLQLKLHMLVPPGSASLVMKGKKVRFVDHSALTDPILREEVEYVQQKSQNWVGTAIEKRAREKKKDRVQRLGIGIECACCCDEYDIDDMVSCRREGHLFCVDCLQQYASTKIFGEGNLGIDKKTKEPSLDLVCFHPEGCQSPFDRNILVKALTSDTLLKYDEIQANLTISKAGLRNLATCPKCNFQADIAPSQKVFECPCDDCRFVSCRECKEAAHAPLRCEEVTKDAMETKGRLTVEEAITAAKIRTCPKCNKPFIKSDGCNKIRCACGSFVCYLCSELISGYEHFCQTPLCKHESCNKCRLYTNAEKDDELAMKKAGLSAASDVKVKMAELTSKEVNIDVESILRKPTGSVVAPAPQPRQV